MYTNKLCLLLGSACTVDVERFAGLNIHSFNPTGVFMEILSRCLGQKCLLFSMVKERCLYSRKNFCSTFENVKSASPANFSRFTVYVYME